MSYSSSDDERSTFLDEAIIKRSRTNCISGNRVYLALTTCNVVFFVASLLFYISPPQNAAQSPKLNPKLRQFSSYTPLLDAVDIPMEVKKINGTLYPSNYPSVARRRPSPEVDAVWNEWEITRIYPVTSAQIRAMGKDPSTATKLEHDIYGLGDDAYASIFDVYHQLHCLNMLRKLVYPDYYTNARHQFMHSTDPKTMFETHMAHCVDILMQSLQCNGNLNLITMHWVQEESIPFPDMSVNRQCMADFADLTQWRIDNTVDLDKYIAMEKPAGVKQLHSPDAYYKYFAPDKTNPNHIDGANEDDDFNL